MRIYENPIIVTIKYLYASFIQNEVKQCFHEHIWDPFWFPQTFFGPPFFFRDHFLRLRLIFWLWVSKVETGTETFGLWYQESRLGLTLFTVVSKIETETKIFHFGLQNWDLFETNFGLKMGLIIYFYFFYFFFCKEILYTDTNIAHLGVDIFYFLGYWDVQRFSKYIGFVNIFFPLLWAFFY